MAQIDTWLQNVADAKASGNMHGAKWLTASWMPYTQTMRSAAWDGTSKGPSMVEPAAPVGPIRNGKIVFHSSTLVRKAETPSVE